MSKNRILIRIIILILCICFSGCASLQRKFTRKKEKEKMPAPVITTYDYSKDLRVAELYKKHFLFWKTWQGELIERIGGTYKKRIECYDHMLMDLEEMENYLAAPKSRELKLFIEKIKSIGPNIRKGRLSKSERNRLRYFLEKTKRQIDRRFSYSKVKGFLSLRK